MLFKSLIEFQIEIESRLHCIDIFDDDCMLKYIKVTAVRSRKMARFSDNKGMEINYFYSLVTFLHSKMCNQGFNARKVNCSSVYSAYILKPVLSGRSLRIDASVSV